MLTVYLVLFLSNWPEKNMKLHHAYILLNCEIKRRKERQKEREEREKERKAVVLFTEHE